MTQPRLYNANSWATDTFNQAELDDKRRTKRLVDIATRAAQHSRRSLAFACEGDEAVLEGAYRFMRNNKVQPQAIRASGFKDTAKRAAEHDKLLQIDDTTSLSYKHSVAKPLGKLGKATDKARG